MRVRTIRPRWWAYASRILVALMLVGMLAILMLSIPARLFAEKPSELIGTFFFASTLLIALLLIANTLPPYRVEVDQTGVRIIGLLYRRDILWSEVEDIVEQSNFRTPGSHALILVNGSHLPQRNWEQLWFKGYQIVPGNSMRGHELVRYLRRRHADWRKRAGQSARTTLEGAQ